MKRWLLVVLACALAPWVQAATFSLPSGLGTAPFASCSATTFNCSSSVTIGNNDTVNVTSDITLNISGNFTLGNGSSINVTPGRTLTIITSGNVNIDNNATAQANFQAGGTITTGANTTVTGNLASTGTTSLGANSVINGNVAGSGISFGNGATLVNGSCSPANAQCVGAFRLGMVSSAASVPANTNFTYTLTLGNTTATSLAGVVVTDNLTTAGLSYVSCTPTVGTCIVSGVNVTWNVGTLATGATPSAVLTVQAPSAGTYTNTANATNTTNASTASATSIVQVYSPLADWRMDEASWNGTAAEVKDSSGNGYNGRARIANGSTVLPTTASGSPAYSSGGRSTCGYGDFDRASGPTRTYSYVELSGIPALPTSFTFAAWIKSTNPNQSGQRILVRDDAQNGWGFSLGDPGQAKIRLFNRNIQNSGSVRGDGTNGNCGVFCLDTAAVITANNWFFVAVAIDTVGKTVTHYVYNASGTLVSSTSSDFTGTWQDGTGTASLGGETSASSEGTTASFHFQGNVDEVQIYNGVLSQSDVNILRTRSRTCVGGSPDHVELVHNGAALTCSPKAVTVLGCTTSTSCSGIPADQYTAGNLTFTPTPISGAQWCTDALCATPITGAITVANNSTIYLREPTVRTDRMAGTASGSLNTVVQCKNTTSGAFNATSACDVAYAGSGFLVTAPNHTSCTAQTVTLQAVQASATSNTCVPAFQNVTRNVSLYSSYTNPTTGTRTAAFNYVTSAGGATSAVASLSTSASTPTTLSGLYFNNTGTATLSNFTYADVGQVSLFPTYAGSAATNDDGLALAVTGSNAFIAAPASFDVVPTGPYVAGQSFAASVTAKNGCASPAVAPNFGRETTAQTVTLQAVSAAAASATNSQLVGPVGGQVGNLTPGVFTLAKCSPTSAGTVCDTALAWTEVGNVSLSAANSNYLGSGLSSWGAGAAGPFRPASLRTDLDPGQACGAFTYSGQPFRLRVTAQSAANAVLGSAVATTQNYTGTFAKAVTLGAVGAAACVPDATGFANNTLPATNFVAGVGSTAAVTNTAAPLPISYTRAVAVPAGVTVCARDADNVNSFGQTQATVLVRNGRVRLTNAYGSERLALPIPTVIEQYLAAPDGWRAGVDACTVIAPANFAFTYPVHAENNLEACETAVGVAGVNPSPTVTLLAPGTGNNGWVSVTLNLGAVAAGTRCTAIAAGAGAAATTVNAPWLQFPWAGAGAVNPSARATFGVYRSPLIYRRENY